MFCVYSSIAQESYTTIYLFGAVQSKTYKYTSMVFTKYVKNSKNPF